MLQQYFQAFGELIDCVVIKNPATKLSRCFGFVQFTTPQIADHTVESRPHYIDGKEIDVKHASAESHERHQQQLAAAALGNDRTREPSPDKHKKRSRWEMQQSMDSQRAYVLPHDMVTLSSNTHMAFVQRDMITYPVPLKYVRDFRPYSPPPRHQNNNNYNNRMYQT